MDSKQFGFDPVNLNTEEPAANITSSSEKEVTTTFKYDVRVPQEYMSDYMVQIRASDLERAREVLLNSKKNHFPTYEIFLAISTTCAGCFLGALCSQIALNTILGIIMYIIAPIIACTTFVTYLFMLKDAIKENSNIASNALEYLADPENSVRGNIDEHK